MPMRLAIALALRMAAVFYAHREWAEVISCFLPSYKLNQNIRPPQLSTTLTLRFFIGFVS